MKFTSTLATLLVSATTAFAQTATPEPKKFPAAKDMTPDAQITLATSAAPKIVSDAASVWIVKPAGGFELAKQGTNGYGCLIQSNRFPRCDDAEGVAAVFPVIFYTEEMRSKGSTQEQINAAVAEGYRTGKFRAPKAGSMSYMLSCDPQSVVPPHVMYTSPYATLESLGLSRTVDAQTKELGLSILGPGTPDAYVVMMTPHWKCEKGS